MISRKESYERSNIAIIIKGGAMQTECNCSSFLPYHGGRALYSPLSHLYLPDHLLLSGLTLHFTSRFSSSGGCDQRSTARVGVTIWNKSNAQNNWIKMSMWGNSEHLRHSSTQRIWLDFHMIKCGMFISLSRVESQDLTEWEINEWMNEWMNS